MKTRYILRLLSAAGIVAFALAACSDGDSVPQDTAAPINDIAFGARTKGSDGQYGLYLIQPDGSELQRLSSEPGFIFFPRWSPSGERIAYIVGTEGEESAGTLRVYDVRTGQAITVSEQALPSLQGPAAAWSPDGAQLVFAEAGDGGSLRIYDIDRRAFVELPEIAGTTPDWSPRGGEIVYVSSAEPGRDFDLYLMETDGENARPLLELPGTEANPRWSPDGARIAFWTAPADRPEERTLVVVDGDGGIVSEVGPGFAAVWSPDGTRLAYSSPPPENPADLEIYLATLDQDEPQRLAEDASVALDSWPVWSPDASQLAYVALIDQQTALLCVARLEPPDTTCFDLEDDLIPVAPAWR